MSKTVKRVTLVLVFGLMASSSPSRATGVTSAVIEPT